MLRHYPQGKIAANVAARGHLLVQEGFVVLSVDAIGAGERATVHGKFEHHGYNGVPLLSLDETLLGMQVYDNMRAIDLLQSLDYVDGNRIEAFSSKTPYFSMSTAITDNSFVAAGLRRSDRLRQNEMISGFVKLLH